MKLKKPLITTGIVGAALAVALASSWLLSAACFAPNLVGQPSGIGGTPQVSEPEPTEMAKATFELLKAKAEEDPSPKPIGGLESKEGLPSVDRALRVAVPGRSLATDNIHNTTRNNFRAGVESNKHSSLTPDEPVPHDIIEFQTQGLLPDIGEVSTPTPKSVNSADTAVYSETGPGAAVSVSRVHPSISPVSPAEAGEKAVHVDCKKDASGPILLHKGNCSSGQTRSKLEKGELKYPNLGTRLN